MKSNGNAFSKAQTDKDKGFFGWVETVPGQNTLSIEATDDSPNANVRTQHFTINVTGQSRVPSYDFNGNMTANGLGQTYQWDAENRLVKIIYADLSSTEFAYDGMSRRTRITEKNSANVTTSDKRYIWSGGNQPAEERDATSNAVTKRFFAEGEQRIGGADAGFYYYAKDHLGSVREITNSTGAIAARYDFDLWGKRTKLSGTLDSEVGYTGHHHHAKSGLVLTWYRAYDAELGRWLSADPIGEAGGLNLYGYLGNEPVSLWDPLGLKPCAENQNKLGKEAQKWISNILKSLKHVASEGIKHARSPGPGFGKVVGPIDTGVKTLEVVPDAVRLLGHEKMRQRLFDSDFDSEDLEKYDNRKWQDGYKKCK